MKQFTSMSIYHFNMQSSSENLDGLTYTMYIVFNDF